MKRVLQNFVWSNLTFANRLSNLCSNPAIKKTTLNDTFDVSEAAFWQLLHRFNHPTSTAGEIKIRIGWQKHAGAEMRHENGTR